MSILEFIAKVIDSLVWPVLVAWLVYGFRSPIGTLIGRLTSLRYKGLEAEFEKRLNKIAPDPDMVSAYIAESPDEQQTISLLELAEIAPRAAVLEAWIQIEKATRDYLDSIGIERRMSYQGLLRLPDEYKTPLKPILTAYQELRLLRNKVTHSRDDDITADSAKWYVDVALWVAAEIRRAIQ